MRIFKVVCDYCGKTENLLTKVVNGEPDILISPDGWLVLAKEFSEDPLDVHACPACVPKPKRQKARK
jgi:hypothetical protein